ncbi:MAG: queuosine precursor transporter [Candidatus Paceibacterota bacterium]
MQTLTEKDYKKILICLTLYITSLFAANTLGIKTMPFLFSTHLSVAVFSFPIVFIMTDVIGEVYGKKMANNFVFAGVISILLFLFYSFISDVAPWSQNSSWAKDSFSTIFGISARFSIASIVAFIIAEYQDVLSFFFLKKKIGEKQFWLRSNLSNVWSQFFDSAIFILIAFVGTGRYSGKDMLLMIIAWWIYKVFMGFLFTPLSYLGIRLLRGKQSNASYINQN